MPSDTLQPLRNPRVFSWHGPIKSTPTAAVQLLVDLRSDTVTQPSAGMRQAMLDAPVGDDVFGEDESIQALQRRCAELTGHEAALFCPSGTMTNQIAIQVHTRPGDEVICDKLSHIYNYEGGGIARNSGASVRLMHGDRGRYDVEEMIANINPADSHYARTSLVAVEDTCNKGGGAIWNVDELARLSEASRARGLGFHLDGARVWNAWVERGEWGDASALQKYGRLFDSMSLCLSKGWGALWALCSWDRSPSLRKPIGREKSWEAA